MSWTKGDGAKIRVKFNLPLIGNITGQQSNFTVTVPEYDFVPDGTLINVQKTVLSTYGYTGLQSNIDLSASAKDGVSGNGGTLGLEVV